MVRGMNKSLSRRRVVDQSVFRGLTSGDAKLLRKAARPMSFPQGATIQRCGTVDRRCFVVLDGFVELSDDELSFTCGPGGVFGDAGSYGRALPATAVARTQVRTFMIPSLVMANLAIRNDALAVRLARMSTESASLAG